MKMFFWAALFCLPGLLHAADFKFNAGGKFKIMQVADTHIDNNPVGTGAINSQVTVDMLRLVLDAEKPDLVIFTGDNVTGRPYKRGFDLLLEPVVSRQIPWAAVFGNHDAEQELSYEQLADLVQSYPYNVGKMKKIKGVSGYGNYIIEIKDRNGKKTEALLYCMDSHQYSTLKPTVDGYGWFAFDQVDWYRKQSDKYTAANRGTPLPALAFFHIPLPEYRAVYKEEGHKLIGAQLENVCSPEINTGMFTAMLEKGDVMGMYVGHDHVNDYIFNYCGIALAYGRFSGSKNTYGDLKNGVRLIELTEGQRGFDTWIRLNEEIVINQVKFPDDLPQKGKK
ncbi:MAG: metallophosphoesterase family protein [Tannerella sp.]|nr:metallophosphoesterase family protein [Tannerella sp.]